MLSLAKQLQVALAEIADARARIKTLSRRPKNVRQFIATAVMFTYGQPQSHWQDATPAGSQPCSPFSHLIEAMAVYLHYTQVFSLERLRTLMEKVFGRAISECALYNVLVHARKPRAAKATTIAASVCTARVVRSDRTSVPVVSRTW